MKNNLKNMGFLGGLDGKESAWNIGDLGWSLGQGDPLEEGMATPTPVFLTGEFHGWRNLAGYSPLGCKELDTMEWLYYTAANTQRLVCGCGWSFLNKSLSKTNQADSM